MKIAKEPWAGYKGNYGLSDLELIGDLNLSEICSLEHVISNDGKHSWYRT